MPNDILLYVGSVLIALWGISYIALVMRAAARSRELSRPFQVLVRMECFAEGVLLVFIGIMTALLNRLYGSHNAMVVTVYGLSALLLVCDAAWHAISRARPSLLPMKLSPVTLASVAILFVLGMFFGVQSIV